MRGNASSGGNSGVSAESSSAPSVPEEAAGVRFLESCGKKEKPSDATKLVD